MILIPPNAIVLLIGTAGAGKSTFARRHFPEEAIISTDAYRRQLGGDASSQQGNAAVFERVHRIVAERAAAGLLTVIDATNTRAPQRTELGWPAHRHRRPLIAVALDLPLEVCLAQNDRRPAPVPTRVIRQQFAELRHLDTDLEVEGYQAIHVFRSTAEVEAAEIVVGKMMA